jgi:hypothetical protein
MNLDPNVNLIVTKGTQLALEASNATCEHMGS